jgi:hypothetical protein
VILIIIAVDDIHIQSRVEVLRLLGI